MEKNDIFWQHQLGNMMRGQSWKKDLLFQTAMHLEIILGIITKRQKETKLWKNFIGLTTSIRPMNL